MDEKKVMIEKNERDENAKKKNTKISSFRHR